jgi:hypothetical protein
MNDVGFAEGVPVDVGHEEQRFSVGGLNPVIHLAVYPDVDGLATMSASCVNIYGERLVA